MDQTRVDSKKLAEAAVAAVKHLDAAHKALEAYLVALTEEERQSTLKPSENFPSAGRSLARSVIANPHIAQAAGCEPAAIVEDLDNVEILQPVMEKVALLQQRLADSRLAWLAEAYQPSLTIYGVAKTLAKTDGKAQQIVEPLAQIFSTRRQRKAATDK